MAKQLTVVDSSEAPPEIDFFTKSAFGLLFIVAGLVGWKLPGMALNLFYPRLHLSIVCAAPGYKQSWGKTLAKSVVLLCETLLFIAVNMIGFFIAFSFM
jgi:hypothetical protein